MATTLFYFLLIAFWASYVMRFELSQVRGISLMNLSLLFLLFAWAVKIWRTRRFTKPNNLNIFLILMVFIALVSVPIQIITDEIPGRTLSQGIMDVKNWANPIIIFFCLINILGEERQAGQALNGLLVFVIITVVPMLIDAFGIMNLSLIRDVQVGRSAGFAEANQYASFLVLFIPIFLSLFLFYRNNKVSKIFWGINCALIFMALILTGSRGGILSFVVSINLYLWLLVKEKQISLKAVLRSIILIIVLGSVAYTAAPQRFKETIHNRFNVLNYENIEDLSNSRVQNLRNGLVVFADRPILGHGLNTFVEIQKLRNFETQFNTHNEFLSYLIHFGILGFGVFVIVLIKIFKHIWFIIGRTEDPIIRIICFSYLTGFLGYTLSMLFVNVFAVHTVFWIYTAIIYSYTSKIEVQPKQANTEFVFVNS